MDMVKEKLLQQLEDDDVSTITLVGDPGMWRTWLEREIISKPPNGSFYTSTGLWLSKNEKYSTNLLIDAYDRQRLRESSIMEEWEEEEDEDEEVKSTKNKESSEKKHQMDSENANREVVRTHYHLLVLDGEGVNGFNEELVEEVSFDMVLLLFEPANYLKIIMTRREPGQSKNVIDFEVMPVEESINAFMGITEEFSNIEIPYEIVEAIANKCKCMPAAITVIATTLKYVRQLDCKVRALEQVANHDKPDEGVYSLISCAYDMLPSSVLKRCFWHCVKFFRKYHCIHYNVLITYWIMEGYFDPIDQIEKAYHCAHCALMELIDRGILVTPDVNTIAMEGSALNLADIRSPGFSGTDRLELASVLKKDEGKVLWRISPLWGMIRTVCNPKRLGEVTTLLVDGNRLSQEVRENFLNRMPELQVLAVFKPGFKSISFEIEKLAKYLKVLIFRDCNMLEDITRIKNLRTLAVLEISGAGSLNSFPNELLDGMTLLQTLNLSKGQMKTLPSLQKLTKLRLLILKDCSCLVNLPCLKELLDLETIDLSGATSLSSIQQLDFSSLKNLQLIDLSYTQLTWLPKFGNLEHLSQIILRGCHRLCTLPSFQHLLSLKIIDLSGVHFPKFTQLNPKDVSTQPLPFLPSTLSELYLRNCSELKCLPPTTALTKLEVLDASGASELAFEDESFDHLKYLHYLDLSNTKLDKLPSLSKLHNLRSLLLNNCLWLKKLPEMEGLKKLEVLDLSGCVNLIEVPDVSASAIPAFDYLHYLDLSNTGFEKLPSLSKLRKLRRLLLKNCSQLTELPEMEGLENLEVLDLSGCLQLTELPRLVDFPNLKSLDVSKTGIREPHVILPERLKIITEAGDV